MKKLFLLILILSLLAVNLPSHAQSLLEQNILIDLPTAGMLERGSFDVKLRLFGNGGLLGGVAVGITPNFMIGLSYGGERIIGQGDVNWNPQPGIQAKLRIINETFATPAVVIGFDSQGYGPYNDDFNRYAIKSRGFYAVASKNYGFLFNLGIHGGLNYSLENDDDDKDINIFLGADLSFNREFRFMLEYDLARNDNRDIGFGSGDGYLNAGAQWIFADRFVLQFNWKNILENGPDGIGTNREIKITYFEFF